MDVAGERLADPHYRVQQAALALVPAPEVTQGQIDGFSCQLPYKRHQNRLASPTLESPPALRERQRVALTPNPYTLTSNTYQVSSLARSMTAALAAHLDTLTPL